MAGFPSNRLLSGIVGMVTWAVYNLFIMGCVCLCVVVLLVFDYLPPSTPEDVRRQATMWAGSGGSSNLPDPIHDKLVTIAQCGRIEDSPKSRGRAPKTAGALPDSESVAAAEADDAHAQAEDMRNPTGADGTSRTHGDKACTHTHLDQPWGKRLACSCICDPKPMRIL